MGVSVTGNGFSVGVRRHQSRVLQLEVACRSPTISTSSAANTRSRSAATGSTPSIETLQQPAHERGRSRSTARARASRSPTSWSASISGGSCRATRSTTTTTATTSRAYVQDNWTRALEPAAEPRPALGAVPSDPEHLRLGEPLRPVGASTQERTARRIPQAPAGLIFPGRRRAIRTTARPSARSANFAPRVGSSGRPAATARPASARSWGVFLRHAAPVLQHALREQPAVGRADHDLEPAGRLHRSLPRLPRRQPVPGAQHGLAHRGRSRRSASTSNTPLHIEPTPLQQWNVSVQRQVGEWLFAASYLGQPLDSPVESHRAEPGGLRSGRDHRQHATSVACCSCRIPIRVSSTAPSASSTTPAAATTMRLFLQVAAPAEERPQRAHELDAVQVHERSGDDRRSPDRRSSIRTIRTSTIRTARPIDGTSSTSRSSGRTPRFGERRCSSACSATGRSRRSCAGRAATVRRVTTGVDNALHPALRRGSGRVQILDDPYGDGTPNNYLNRAAFTSPAPGTYSTLAPFSIVNPSSLQNDIAVSRTFKLRQSQIRAVPVGESSTCLNHGQLQRAGDGSEQRELRQDPDRRRSRGSCSSA